MFQIDRKRPIAGYVGFGLPYSDRTSESAKRRVRDMLRMFRTINGQVEQNPKPENGSWLCLSDPTDVELANVSMETGVDLADLRAPP